MANITEHNAKKERESHNGKDTWIDLLVSWNTVGVDDLLEDPCDFIKPELGRWSRIVVIDNFERGYLDVMISIFKVLDLAEDLMLVLFGDPTETEVQLLLNLELVQCGVEELLLLEEDAVDLKKRNRDLLVVGLLLVVHLLHLAQVVLKPVSRQFHKVRSFKNAALQITHFVSNLNWAET